MASETVDPIDWSHPPPYIGQYPPELHVLHTAIRAANQKTCDFRMPDQRTAGAATQGIKRVTPRVTRSDTYGTGYTTKRWCLRLYLIFYSIHNTSTDRRCAMSLSNTPQLKKWHHWLHGPVVSEADHHTTQKYSKNDRTKPQKHLKRSDLLWNTRQDFFQIPYLWSCSETEGTGFSNVIL